MAAGDGDPLVPESRRPNCVVLGGGVAASQSPGINGNGATPTPLLRIADDRLNEPVVDSL